MSIKANLQKAIFDGMINKVRTDSSAPFVVLVVDQRTTKILSSCARMYDIMEQGVLVLENLDLARERLQFAAIYFISPTEESIQKVIKDFSMPKKPQYSSAHLFFTSRVSTDLVKLIKGAPNLLKRVKTFQELNLDFQTVEHRVFSFQADKRNPLKNLYFPDSTEAQTAELKLQASQLVSLLLTQQEDPYIRYHEGHGNLCKAFAKAVEVELAEKKSLMPDWKASENRDRGTLLIVDRSMDPVSPLMHEYTFQAMVNDLLKVQGEMCTLPEGHRAEQGLLLLSEDDDLWMEFRHSHIGEVMASVTSKFREFKGNNATAKYQAEGENASVKDVMNAIKSMPKYQDIMKKYAKSLNLAEACMEKFNNQKLKVLGELEQDMATGLDESGAKVDGSTINKKLMEMCQDPDVGVLDKLRLLMIYIISQRGIQDATRKQLMAKIDTDLHRCVSNLDKLGVDISSRKTAKHSKARLAEFSKRNQVITLALMRYVPFIHQHIMELVSNSLSESEFPCLNAPAGAGAGKRKPKGKAARMHMWRKAGGKGKEDENKEDTRPLITVFVLGGITFAELRSMYEIGEAQNANIICGGANILKPAEFVRMIADLPEKKFVRAVLNSEGTRDPDQLPPDVDISKVNRDSFDD